MGCLCGHGESCKTCAPERYRKAELKANAKATDIMSKFLITPFEQPELHAAIVRAIMDEFH